MAAQSPGSDDPLSYPPVCFQRIPILLAGFLFAILLFLPTTRVQADAPPPVVATPAACGESPGCPLPVGIDRAIVDPIWWNENKINQINPETYTTASELLSNPYNTCGPTTLALVINYVYALRGELPPGGSPVTPSQVMAAAKELGLYDPPDNDGLLGADDLRAIARQFGLEQVFPKGGGSYMTFDALFTEMKKGFPAIVGMRYHYDEATGEYRPAEDDSPMNHYVILFGITDDGNYFWMLNTHPGIGKKENAEVSLKLMTFDAFKAAWTLKDGTALNDYGNAVFLR